MICQTCRPIIIEFVKNMKDYLNNFVMTQRQSNNLLLTNYTKHVKFRFLMGSLFINIKQTSDRVGPANFAGITDTLQVAI